MANTPDDLSPRPKDGDEALPGPKPPPQDSDSAIDFSELNEEQMSGISVIEWASLVESPSKSGTQPRAETPPAIDEESMDLGGMFAEARPRTPRPGDSSIDLGSSGVIDLDAEATSASSPSGSTDNVVDLSDHGDAIDLGSIDLDSAGPASGDVIELGAESLVGGGSASIDDEAIELGDEAIVVHEAMPSGVGTSGIDLAGPASPPSRGGSSVSFDDDMLLETAKGGSGGSKRDLIAENLESGIDLLNRRSAAEEEEDDFLAAAQSDDDESSSVDLGSMHSLPVFDVNDEPEGAALKGSGNKKRPEQPDDDEAIDLGDMDQINEASDVDIDLERAGGGEDADDGIDLTGGESAEVAEATPQPEKKEPKKRGAGALVGSGAAGLLVGAAAMFGGVMLSVVPGIPPVNPKPLPLPNPDPIGGGPGGAVRTMGLIRLGDFGNITDDDVLKFSDADPEHMVARAEFYWLRYLSKTRGADPKANIPADEGEVKKALDDAQKAANSTNKDAAADAYSLIGQIHEATGKFDDARAAYEAGAKLDGQKERFDAALQVMGLAGKSARLVPARDFALVLFALQAPGGDAPAPPAVTKEAGLAFWQAMSEAKAGRFPEAIKLIDEAKSRHDQRRYQLVKKGLNPQSDPREEIFLKACDQIKNYWQLQRGLSSPGTYLALDAKSPERVKGLDDLVAKAQEDARAALVREAADRLAKGKKIDSLDDLVKVVVAEGKAKDDALVALQKTADDRKAEADKLGIDLKTATVDLDKTRESLKASETGLTKAKADSDAALAALREVGVAAESEFKDLKTSKMPLVSRVVEWVKTAKANDPTGELRRLQIALDDAKGKLAQRWEPAQMLAYWVPLLDRERESRAFDAAARRDAGLVLGDAKAAGADARRARLVQGLALRNEGKVDAAKAALNGALPDPVAEAALADLNDPVGVVVRRAAELVALGKRPEAKAALSAGIRDLPDPKGKLYLRRAWLSLDEALAKGTLNAADPLVKAARDDAQASGEAEGLYLQGRLDEQLDKREEALKHYDAARKAHNLDDEEGNRYRVAWALLKRKTQPSAAPAERPLPPPTRTGRLPRDTSGMMMAVAWYQPASDEADQLLDQVRKSNKVSKTDRALATFGEGRYTQGIKEYVAALRDSGRLPPDQAAQLLALLAQHPRLTGPEPKLTPDPLRGERHYAQGLNFFFAKCYSKAETEFLSAVENDANDARYFYFLGLSRLALGKRGSAEDFDRGARLEEEGRPDRAAVAQALERIQGRMRRAVTEARERPRDGAQ